MTEFAQTLKESLEVVGTAVQPLVDRLDLLAEKLGTTAMYLWQLQVKQAYVVGFTNLLTLLLIITAVFIAYKVGLKVYGKYKESVELKRKDHWRDDVEIDDFATVIIISALSLGSVFALVYASTLLPQIIYPLLNPEHYALKEIIQMLK